METCNHRVSAKNTSITLLKDFETMVYPKKVYGVCEICGEGFEYIMDKKGKLKPVKEENN